MGMCLTGCESSDDNSATGTNGVSQTEIMLASGSATAADGVATVLGVVTSPGKGNVIANVSWSGGATLTGYFKKSDPTNYGWVQGASPMTSTAAVEAGDGLTYYIANTTGADVSVTYTIRYVSE